MFLTGESDVPTQWGMIAAISVLLMTNSLLYAEETTPMETTTIISFVLDESGSMESIKDDTIGGFNQYLASLQDPSHGPVSFSLVKFDSNAITKVYVGTPIAEVAPLTRETYRPGASTPLIDAVYKTIRATEDVVAQRQDNPPVLIVIQTDGQENASTEHTNADLHHLVKEKTALGWGFVFLGAGIDAFAQAGQWGINKQSTLNYSRGHSIDTFGVLTSNTASFRASGAIQSLDFTGAQRQQVAEPGTPLINTEPPVVATPSTETPPVRSPIVDDFSLRPDEQEVAR